MIELISGINGLKKGKAAGLDDICTEQTKHFGPAIMNLLLKLTHAQPRTKYPRSGDEHMLWLS